MTYRGICLLDLDGTLTDPREGITKALRHALSCLGMEVGLEGLEAHIGPPLRETFTKGFGLDGADAESAVSRFREYYSEKGIYENAVYPGIPEALALLASGGLALAVATSKPTAYAERVLAHFGIGRHVRLISGDAMDGSLTKGGKDEVVRIALDALDPGRAKPASMVGDRMHDIAGAKANGIEGIGVLWGYGSRRELTEAGADYIAVDVEALLGYLLP